MGLGGCAGNEGTLILCLLKRLAHEKSRRKSWSGWPRPIQFTQFQLSNLMLGWETLGGGAAAEQPGTSKSGGFPDLRVRREDGWWSVYTVPVTVHFLI